MWRWQPEIRVMCLFVGVFTRILRFGCEEDYKYAYLKLEISYGDQVQMRLVMSCDAVKGETQQFQSTWTKASKSLKRWPLLLTEKKSWPTNSRMKWTLSKPKLKKTRKTFWRNQQIWFQEFKPIRFWRSCAKAEEAYKKLSKCWSRWETNCCWQR